MTVSETPLPPVQLRAGGKHFRKDRKYLKGGVRDATRLRDLAGLDESSSVLDWGCGSGRLAIGFIESGIPIRSYLGVDVRTDVIEWASEHLGNDTFRFVHVDAPNDRYNSDGSSGHTLPAETGTIDALYAYSVMSHMLDDDVRAYLGEIERVLSGGGRAVLTAFVEEGVPDVAENPEDYGPLEWSGPLHCVRFERSFFERMVAEAGLTVAHFEHGNETDGQSLLVLAKARR